MPDIVSCPQCERKLRVPDDLLGKKVKCPTCGTTFTAETGGAAVAPLDADVEGSPVQEREEPLASSAPVARSRPRRDRDDDDDYDDRPVRRRRLSGDMQPHRGVLILVLGIGGIVICGILAPIAWVMGNADMTEIRAGRMDPEGEGLTNAGRIIGMVGTILMAVSLVIGCILVVIAIGAGAAAGGRR